jgi:hypothetical protein
MTQSAQPTSRIAIEYVLKPAAGLVFALAGHVGGMNTSLDLDTDYDIKLVRTLKSLQLEAVPLDIAPPKPVGEPHSADMRRFRKERR